MASGRNGEGEKVYNTHKREEEAGKWRRRGREEGAERRRRGREGGGKVEKGNIIHGSHTPRNFINR